MKTYTHTQEDIMAAKSLKLVIKDGAKNVEQLHKFQKIAKITSIVLIYAFIVAMAFIVIVPFYWMIATSLKSEYEIRETLTYYPHTIQWINYKVLFAGAEKSTFMYDPVAGMVAGNLNDINVISPFEFWTFLANTLIVGVISTLGTLFTTILAAFAFSRLNFKGKDTLFTIFLATMMIPGEMFTITNYITVSNLGWLDSTAGQLACMIVPFWVSVFYIFQLRQNFKQIPNELYYAAKVDGKSDWQYLWKVMVPLASPSLITILILKVMGSWNAYVWPDLVGSEESYTMAVGLRRYSPSPFGSPHQGIQMAATVLVTVPLFLLFVFFRKYIMRGVGRAGIKG